MNEDVQGGSSKWDQATDAINQVTFGFDQILRFGLMYFPTQGDCGMDLGRGLLSAVAPSNGGDIRNELDRLGRPDGGTPLGESIEKGVDYFNNLNDDIRENIIVVITDGDDTCRGNPVRKAENAFQAGYKVYVIGFGRGVDGNTLRRMAEGGGTNDYFQANNASELFEALRTIANQASVEECDGADNDCDGIIDEDIDTIQCETNCGLGERICIDGQLSNCAGGAIPVESCDGNDNDCDGIIDEVEYVPCTTPSNQPGSAECLEGGEISEDCMPDDPNREEICDGRDNDVDGLIDENTSRDCQNECHFGREVCIEGQLRDCSAAPVVEEVCNGFDDDCDELIDEMSTCPGAEICGDEGQCLQPCDNDECFPGFVCQSDGFCHPFPCEPTCPEGQRCISQMCITYCLVDAQCAVNEICDAEAQRCIPDPNSSSPMPMGGMMSMPMGGSMNTMGGSMNNPNDPNNPNANPNDPNANPNDPNVNPNNPYIPPNPMLEEMESQTASCSTPTKPYALWGFLFSLFALIQLLKRDHFKA
jgi:hypothetical protein